MTKRIFIIIGFFLASIILAAVFSGCSKSDITASLGQEFTLPAGDRVEIKEEGLFITFLEVAGDSRCPSDVICVWMGEAKCRLSVEYKGSSHPLELVAGGTLDNKQAFNEYTIEFNLQPYPVSTQQIAPEDYYLVMTVSR